MSHADAFFENGARAADQSRSQKDHWDGHARQWSLIGPPLRPSAEDIAFFQTAAAASGPEGLILGATPELARVAGRSIFVDRNPAMLVRLSPNLRRVAADWLQPPFPAASFDFAIGDGSLNMLNYPEEYALLFSRLRDLLRTGGRVALRVFAAPERPESSEHVVAAAKAGEIGGFHAFKWRLAMALAAEGESANIGVAKIHQGFCARVPDRADFCARTGWSRAQVDAIDVYADSALFYSFPTKAEAVAAVAEHFSLTSIGHGSYELGERCPTMAFSKG